jgi:hypothetical protein
VGSASGTTSGSNLAQGANNSPGASQTFTATSTKGNVTLTNSSTVTNVSASGTPVATNTGATINVYSGLSTWATNGGGSWGTLSSGFGANWGSNEGSPGVTSGFANTDTATFGSALTSGTATVSLNGASPSLSAITFNNSSASYTIAQGTGGTVKLNGSPATITDSAGNHTISAPVELDSNAATTVSNSGDKLTVSGIVSESGGARTLTVNGPGSTILTANNTYSGGTTVSSGKLYINNTGGASYSVPNSSALRPITATNSTGSGTGTGSVTVSSGGTLAGGGTIAPTSGGVTINNGGTLSSGALQTAFATVNSGNGSVNGTGTGGGLTINNSSNLSSALIVNGGATLTFDLGSSTAYTGGSGALDFADPNTNSTYLSIAGNTTDQIFSNTSIADAISLVDLTNGAAPGGVSLTLRAQNPYLLIQTALGNNGDFANLWTTGGEGQNGYVLGVSTGVGSNYTAFTLAAYDINGNLISSSSNLEGLRLYLYNGDLEVVPEPGTWAMMLAGLALLVVIQRQRRRSKQD